MNALAAVAGLDLQTGTLGIVHMADDGSVARVETGGQAPVGLPSLAPGLVDVQINGCAGQDFTAVTLDDEMLRVATHFLWREGVTTYLPTVLTSPDEVIEAALRAIAGACVRDDEVGSSVGGIHLEGPFISPLDGPRGMHDVRFIKAPDWFLVERWQAAAQGRLRVITMSPEWPGCEIFIERCRSQDIRVAIGHTAASPEQIRSAIAAGAHMSTHLGNGAHLMLPRHPNYVWEQLAADELWAGVIADGAHLPDAVLKVVLRVKGERTVLVSDAVALSGMPPGDYLLESGTRVTLDGKNRLHPAGEPRLHAGSTCMLRDCIAHLVRAGLCSLTDAWRLASTGPAACMHLPTAPGIAAGAPADLVLFEWTDGQVQVQQTYKRGRLVYDAREP